MKNYETNEKTEAKKLLCYEHKDVVQKLQKLSRRVLWALKERQLISWYELTDERTSFKKETLYLSYNMTLSTRSKKIYGIDFELGFDSQITPSPFQVTTYAEKMVVQTSHPWDEAALMEECRRKLEPQLRGILREELFLGFLLNLKKTQWRRITHVHHASNYHDKKKGIDFIVYYRCHKNTHEIPFNLKSSSRYLDKHKARYPGISTFTFREAYLENREKLARIFFSFLNDALLGPAHYGPRPRAA